MNERIMFLAEYLKAERPMVDLCRDFGISRKTGYKWVARYRADGAAGLLDRSRAPLTRPNAIPASIVERIVAVRRDHPTWGPRKLLAWLQTNEPKLILPAASTVGEMLRRYGLSEVRPGRRKRVPRYREPFADCSGPNQTWCADYKGEFRVGGRYCYPLTITDAYSRFLLSCRGRQSTNHVGAQPIFRAAFREHGLPEVIRTDNGAPFATRAPQGLSRLSIWWLKLGIRHERITPGRPSQNGRHERMHRTLKQETAKPPARTMRRQQRRFDDFRAEYNEERPHEALDDRTPRSVYECSERSLPARVPRFSYPADHRLRRVHESGRIRWPGRHVILLGAALAGETVDCVESTEGVWKLFLGPLQLGLIDTARLELGLIQTEN